MRLDQIASYCEAKLLRGNPEREVNQISTDTRTLNRGDCFVALCGPQYDGHEFLDDAAQRGASAAVVSNPTRAMNSPSALALLEVQDTLTTLHKLATNYRRLMPPTTRIISISGACGKTTTKEMVASVLSERFSVFKTVANQNNHIGTPLTLLSGTGDHDYGVVELGSNHPGEMSVLAEMVHPDIAAVTNIGLAHVEFLGDEAGVAQEEGTPLEDLPVNGDGLAVLNVDDPWFDQLRLPTRAAVVTVGSQKFADIRASEIEINGAVRFRLSIAKKRDDVIIRLRTVGKHMVYNALQAAAIGYMQGLELDEIREGLESVSYPAMRMQQVDVDGIRFLNDCYNATVPSMKAALESLDCVPCEGKKIAVLGDMLELGAFEQQSHREMGLLAANVGLDRLVTVGSSARWIAEGAMEAGLSVSHIQTVDDVQQVIHSLRGALKEGDLVLLKGSRQLRLETVLDGLRETVHA